MFNLSKDAPVFNLTKEVPSISQFLVCGCSWKTKNNRDVDLDLSVVVVDKNDNKLEVAYYGNSKQDLLQGSLFHFGDDLTGSNAQTDTDNEQVRILLDKMPANAKSVFIMAGLYSGQMNDVTECSVCIRDSSDEKILNSTAESLSSGGVMFAKIVKNDDGEWDIERLDWPLLNGLASNVMPYIKGNGVNSDAPEPEKKKGFFGRLFS